MIKQTLISLFASAGLWLALASAAHADTDYRCLNLCATGGKSSASCMKQCTYGNVTAAASNMVSSPEPDSSAPQSLSNHRVLPVFQTIDPHTILPDAQAASPYRETKDYQCVTKCLQTKMQYQLCSDGCTTVTTKDGKVIKMGVAPTATSGNVQAQAGNRLVTPQSMSTLR